MNAVINFEYLVAPALSKDIYFDKIVDNLRLFSELLSAGVCIAFLEKNIVSKMEFYDCFPSERIFQRKISKLTEGTAFCSGDIVRVVNVILSSAEELEEQHVVEWVNNPAVESNFNAISQVRMEELNNLYCSMAVDGFLNKSLLKPIYFHPENPALDQGVSFTGIIKDVFPECKHALPLDFVNYLNIISNIDDLFSEMDGYELYKKAKIDLEYKFAFYVGVISLIKQNRLSANIAWGDFKIGKNFIKSLQENECYQDQNYSSVVYESVINLLADTGKNDVNPFNTSATSSKQRACEGFLAYRVHVTRSGRALRLLFWKDDYEIILSNIGNKFEVLIYTP